MKAFKEIFTSDIIEEPTDLLVEETNLKTAGISAIYIDQLLNDFRKSKEEFLGILNLKELSNYNTLQDKITNFNNKTWVLQLYSKALGLVNKARNIRSVTKIHNLLFPDESKESLTEEELLLIKQLTGRI